MAVPPEIPVTTPDVLTVATDGAEVLQVPPATLSDKPTMPAGQIVAPPLIAPPIPLPVRFIDEFALTVPPVKVSVPAAAPITVGVNSTYRAVAGNALPV